MWAQEAIFYLWDVWFASWLLAALWADRATGRPGVGAQALHWAITIAGFYLLMGIPSQEPDGPGRVWNLGGQLGWAPFAVAAAGLAFTWWARLYLGRLWSGSVSRKADHRVVDTGPYGLVRHPIYTGLIVATSATAVLRGTIVALAGAALIALGFWIKARLEERFLRQELGAETYDAYRRRVPMLVPFGPL